jgi:hypothetical protein
VRPAIPAPTMHTSASVDESSGGRGARNGSIQIDRVPAEGLAIALPRL